MILLHLSPIPLPLVRYFSRNQAPSTCVCLEKIPQEFGARKHSSLCISGYYSCKTLKQCQRIHRCLLSCWGIGNGQGGGWGWRGLQNLTRLWCWTDTIHLGPSMAYFQTKKCMLPRWPTLSFPIWKVNDFLFFFFFLTRKYLYRKTRWSNILFCDKNSENFPLLQRMACLERVCFSYLIMWSQPYLMLSLYTEWDVIFYRLQV